MQQGLKLTPLVLVWQVGQTLPGPERSPVADLRDQTRQGRNAWQQDLSPDEPISGQVEKVTGSLIAEPGPGIEPPAEAKPPPPLMKPTVLIDLLDFGAMSMVGLLPLHIAGQAGRLGDTQLVRDIGKNTRRHIDGVREKRAEKADGSQLKRKPQAVMIPSMLRDTFQVIIVKMEIACELFQCRLTPKASIPFALDVAEKFNRHGSPP